MYLNFDILKIMIESVSRWVIEVEFNINSTSIRFNILMNSELKIERHYLN